MLRNSSFDADEIEREKGVIVEEMNMYADTPRSYIGNVWERHLYGDQPLGWDIIGTEETAFAARPGHVPRLHRPLVPAGANGRRPRWQDRRRSPRAAGATARLDRPDVDRRRRRGRAARERASRLRPPHEAVRPGAHRGRLAQQPPHGHPDRYAVQLLSTVLGGGMSSRLFTEVREKRGLAYYVSCSNNSYADAGTLAAQAGST